MGSLFLPLISKMKYVWTKSTNGTLHDYVVKKKNITENYSNVVTKPRVT